MIRSTVLSDVSTTSSLINSRTIFLRVSFVTSGWFHARARSSPSRSKRSRSEEERTGFRSVASRPISSSRVRTTTRRSFQRRSSSAVTNGSRDPMHRIGDTHEPLRIEPAQARFLVAIAFPSALAQDFSWRLRQPRYREAVLVPTPVAQEGGQLACRRN
jgi:hypothetical protein